MTLQQALDTIKGFSEFSPGDLVLTIQFNANDEWANASITPRGDPSDDLSSFCGEGDLETVIISLAEGLEQ